MLELVRPKYLELDFRQQLLSDEATMSYNLLWGGTVAFPEKDWADWYKKWLEDAGRNRFYAYLYSSFDRGYVGEAAYRYDEEYGEYIANLIIHSRFRKKGYGREGLALLCQQCKSDGHETLCDTIAADNPSLKLFLNMGFLEIWRNDTCIMVKKQLT